MASESRHTGDGWSAVQDFIAYVEDYGRMGGGEMKRKYGDDPMLGFENIIRRLGPVKAAVKSARAEARQS